MDAVKRIEKLEKEFFKEWTHRNPLLGTGLGLHDEFDDKMPDGSLDRELDDQKFLHRMLSEFQRIDPKHLPTGLAADRELAIHMIHNWLFEREELRYWESVPEVPQVLGQALFQLLSRNYAPLNVRMKAIMKRLDRMPKYIENTKSKLRNPVKLFIEIELETITRLPGFFNLLKDIGREHLPASPQRELNKLIDHTQNTLEKYSDWLIVDVLPDCREGFAIGEEKFRRLLKVRGIELSPQGLLQHAEEEIERLREKQKEVARLIKRKVAIEDVRDLLKQQHAENFDGVLRQLRDFAAKGRQFTNRSKFVQLPEGEQVYVIETPAYLRHFLPFGGVWPPARFEPKHDGYVLATPGDCDSDKLKEHNVPAVATMALREGYPGRHVQMSWAIKHPSPLRALYEDPAVAGGWGFYCEERAKEMGYDDLPPQRFMFLQAQMLQAVRVVADVRLSCGKMGWQDSVEMLIDRLGMDRICAEGESRRYVYSPAASCSQLWGRERLRELRKWARDRMESRFTESFFHTSLLKCGPVPLHVLRHELEAKISEELRRPPDRPEDRKGHGHAPAPGRAGAKTKSRPAPKAKPPRKPAKKKPARRKR
jgi:uncharacterized protein (DUF885 family)